MSGRCGFFSRNFLDLSTITGQDSWADLLIAHSFIFVYFWIAQHHFQKGRKMAHADQFTPSQPARKITTDEARRILDAAFVATLKPASERGGIVRMTAHKDKWQGESTARIAVEDLRSIVPDVISGDFKSINELNLAFGSKLFTGSGLTNGFEPVSYMFDADAFKKIAAGINPNAGQSIKP